MNRYHLKFVNVSEYLIAQRIGHFIQCVLCNKLYQCYMLACNSNRIKYLVISKAMLLIAHDIKGPIKLSLHQFDHHYTIFVKIESIDDVQIQFNVSCKIWRICKVGESFDQLP